MYGVQRRVLITLVPFGGTYLGDPYTVNTHSPQSDFSSRGEDEKKFEGHFHKEGDDWLSEPKPLQVSETQV